MENCVAPSLDKFQSIIKSCTVFGQSSICTTYAPFRITKGNNSNRIDP